MSGMPGIAMTPDYFQNLGMYQQQSNLGNYLNPLSGAQPYNALLAQQNAAMPSRTGIWERERAKSYAKDAERIIERLAFWQGVASVPIVGWLFLRRVHRLTDELDEATDRAERYLRMAEEYEKEHGTNA